MGDNQSQYSLVYLYSELMGYNIGTIRELAKVETLNVSVISWEKKKKTKYIKEEVDNVVFHSRNDFNTVELIAYLVTNKASYIYISGWMDKGYINAIQRYRQINSNAVVVMGLDTQMTNSWRQRLGSIYFKLRYKSLVDYMWIPGPLQRKFAKRLGFADGQILRGLLSADSDKFTYTKNHTKRFLFVGRFENVKNIVNLMEAYKSLSSTCREEWPLLMIGDGSLRDVVNEYASYGVQNIGFLQPAELKQEVAKGGVFVLPSTHEPWGVVVHEFALLGYPLLLSNICGSASTFLRDGKNGYFFDPLNQDSIIEKLNKIVNMSDNDIKCMKLESSSLGKQLTSEISAQYLLSIMTHKCSS
jgi:glycosyltransferase involved in cell wall biosynthesis